MRSQLMIFSMISLAVAGCGKDVQKNGGLAQVNPTGVLGQCADPIVAPNAPAIARFTDQAKAGTYRLVSFEAVGMSMPANAAPAGVALAPNGISVVSGSIQPSGQPTYVQRCQDLSRMAQTSLQWSVSTPSAISAANGAIAEMVSFAQTARGPQAMGPNAQVGQPESRVTNEMAQGCRSADAAIRGEGCAPAAYYQLDASTIAVLRTTESRDVTGAIVRTKVLAKYSLDGAAQPYPTATDDFGFGGTEKSDEFESDDYQEYVPAPKKKPAAKTVQPVVSPGNGQGEKGNGQGSKGNGQGSKGKITQVSSVEIVPQKIVAYVPGRASAQPTVVTGTQVIVAKEQSKEKTDLKIKVSGDDVKVKLKDKGKSKTKSKTETVTTVQKANGDVVTTTTTTKAKEKNKSKLKVKAKAD